MRPSLLSVTLIHYHARYTPLAGHITLRCIALFLLTLPQKASVEATSYSNWLSSRLRDLTFETTCPCLSVMGLRIPFAFRGGFSGKRRALTVVHRPTDLLKGSSA
ncbi:hypothetical protein HRR83_004414 [Exophiala dermatitidis]|uniref:Uncharacterized protein n=1 Tax=Exophiala dermatitidis TaxID=5970 RepID=A0AAN6ETF5_EXODE|nr:hypothetical protein HRR73_006123 [Exophiala dermatitidis]KAJ4521281.1 hypothetical protein HRR74_003104 [Exophiala dermatitidis]KAJ4541944.1 hypothetical protein HRR77_005839 [Exophiala dermatitidis]KAJ4544710.1 hypothetical protein HRR76_002757 [Exophiala dermatitidis]KAJ4565186.1 hypothetical protein HRR79_005458 [Exophiala dermatitidis]